MLSLFRLPEKGFRQLFYFDYFDRTDMSDKQKQFAPIGLIIGCVVFSLGSVIVASLPIGAYAIAFWRLLVAGVIFAILSHFFVQKFPSHPLAYRYAALAGVFLALDLSLWHESIYAVGPGISTLLNSLQIFWLSAIGFVWFKERLTPLQIVSLVMAIVGVALIGSPEFGHNQNALWGFISGLASGLMLSLSMVFIRKVHQIAHTPILPLMFWLSVSGVITLLPLMLLFNQGAILPQTWTQVGLIVIYGAVMQCFAWGLIAYSIPLLSLSITGLLLLSEPVAALLIDYFALDKPINALQWTGALLTMLAIYLGSLKKKN